jgi:hypothetical protein
LVATSSSNGFTPILLLLLLRPLVYRHSEWTDVDGQTRNARKKGRQNGIVCIFFNIAFVQYCTKPDVFLISYELLLFERNVCHLPGNPGCKMPTEGDNKALAAVDVQTTTSNLHVGNKEEEEEFSLGKRKSGLKESELKVAKSSYIHIQTNL